MHASLTPLRESYNDCLQMRKFDDEPLLTIDEVATLFRISESTLRRYIATGKLRPIRLGGVEWGPIRFRKSDVLRRLSGWETR